MVEELFEKSIDGITIECTCGDITAQEDIDAVVNAANAFLEPGGGVAGAIHRAAGPALVQECRSLAPIKPGEAVITKGYNLPNRYVIHCLGPVYGRDKPEDKLLQDCYKNALHLAEKHNLSSIAFPAISTGYFGYPAKDAFEVAIRSVLDEIDNLKSLKRIRFILYSVKDYKLFVSVLERIMKER